MANTLEKILRIRKLREQNVRAQLNQARERYREQQHAREALVQTLATHRDVEAKAQVGASDSHLGLEAFFDKIDIAREMHQKGRRLIDAIEQQTQEQQKALIQQSAVEEQLQVAVRRRYKLEKASEQHIVRENRASERKEDDEADEQAMVRHTLRSPESG